MKVPFPAIVMGMCLVPAAAQAVDWSVQSSASETVELNSNQFMAVSPIGPTVSSSSSISEKAEARTSVSKFDFTSDASYRRYWGPGAEGLPLDYNLVYGFNAHYELPGKTAPDRTWVEADFKSQSSAFALLSELGLVSNVIGSINRLTFSGGADRELNARDTINLSASSTKTSYEPGGAGTAFQDTNANAIWRHRLTAQTSFTASSGGEWLSYGNTFGTNVLILRNQAGIDTSPTSLLTLHGSAGAAYVQTMNGIGTIPASSLSGTFVLTPGSGGFDVTTPSGAFVGILSGSSVTVPIASAAASFIGDVLVTYKPLKSTTLTLTASRSIGPSIVGSLFELSTLRGAVTQTINAASSLTVAADISRSVATTTTDFASASVSYNYQWARAWSASVTYRYLHRFEASGTATIDPITNTPVSAGIAPASSNSLVVTVSRNFTDLGHTN
ncbi:MAG: hypothetical protein P4M07_13255 [Xanthobacteraceae bacterium]|nr:hypothetical protein [Xanthobacteraceae bacterium]